MKCKYGTKKESSEFFMKSLPDESLLHRRIQHDRERKIEDSDLVDGSKGRGSRLLWMRAVRTEIRNRGLGT